VGYFAALSKYFSATIIFSGKLRCNKKRVVTALPLRVSPPRLDDGDNDKDYAIMSYMHFHSTFETKWTTFE
jgi:hypothetical protein